MNDAATQYRLTADAMYNGRLLSREEYRMHIRMLVDLKNGAAISWFDRDMTDIQHAAWMAIHQSGLACQDYALRHVLTPLGHVYLGQRSPGR